MGQSSFQVPKLCHFPHLVHDSKLVRAEFISCPWGAGINVVAVELGVISLSSLKQDYGGGQRSEITFLSLVILMRLYFEKDGRRIIIDNRCCSKNLFFFC